jgi:hypothetical protein
VRKTRITIHFDEDVGDNFLKVAEVSGGSAGYQMLINDAFGQHLEGEAPKLKGALRRFFREVILAAS